MLGMRGASAAGVLTASASPSTAHLSRSRCTQSALYLLELSSTSCKQGRPAEVLSASLTKLLERVYADADAAHGDEATILFC
jgi:hypothetical protein